MAEPITDDTEQDFLVELDLNEFGSFLADAESGAGPTVTDVTGRIVIHDGHPIPEQRALWEIYTEHHGFLTLRRGNPDGTASTGLLWLAPTGCLAATVAPGQETVRLEAFPTFSKYALAIDLAALGPRPSTLVPDAPDDVEVELNDLLDMVPTQDQEQNQAERSAQARNAVAAAIEPLAPACATEIREGQFQLGVAMFQARQNGPADAGQKMLYVDTPSGILLHHAKRKFFSQQHRLERVPAWLLFAQLMAMMQSPVNAENPPHSDSSP